MTMRFLQSYQDYPRPFFLVIRIPGCYYYTIGRKVVLILQFSDAGFNEYKELPKLDRKHETKRFSKSRNRGNYRKWD